MKKLILFIIAGLFATTGVAYAVSVFNSNQVGTNPVSGSVLQTNGSTSTWVPTSSFGYLTNAITVINGATSTSHTFVGGTGISVNDSPDSGNTTTTITNTGVTTVLGSGVIQSSGGTGPTIFCPTCSTVSTSSANTWTANQQFSGGATNASGTKIVPPATYSVCATGCDYPFTATGLQNAMDAASTTKGTVKLGSGTITITATTTFGGSDIHVIGEGNATIIQFNGASTTYAFANNKDGAGASIRYNDELGNLEIVSTAVGQGTCLLLDKFNLGYFHDITCLNANGGAYANGNQTFQNNLQRFNVSPVGANNFGFSLNGLANDNSLVNDVVTPDASGTTTGVVLNNTAGTWINMLWVETASVGTSTTGIGVDIQTGSHNTSIMNSWIEKNNIDIQIASGVQATTIIGDHLAGPTTAYIQDNGSIGTFVQSLVNGDNLLAYGGDNVKMQIGTTTPQPANGFNLYMVGSSTKEGIDIQGEGAAEVQSYLQLESQSTNRGGGTFYYDASTGVKWYLGTCYNTGGTFCINRQTNSTQTSTVAANPVGTNVTNLFQMTTAGGFTIPGNATSTGVTNTSVTTALVKATSTGAEVAAVPGTDYSTTPSPEDFSFKAWDFDPVATVNTGTAVPTSTVFGTTIVLKNAITVTKLRFALIAAGATTTNCFVGLYQNGTMVASSSDISTALQSSLTSSATFNATTTLAAGSLDIAVVIGSASTSPQFIRGVSNSVSNQIVKRFWNADTPTTTLPTTLGTKTAQSNSWWFALQ